MSEPSWNELTSDEQHALERVSHGNTAMLTAAMVARLKALGLVHDRIGGIGLSREGQRLLASRRLTS